MVHVLVSLILSLPQASAQNGPLQQFVRYPACNNADPKYRANEFADEEGQICSTAYGPTRMLLEQQLRVKKETILARDVGRAMDVCRSEVLQTIQEAMNSRDALLKCLNPSTPESKTPPCTETVTKLRVTMTQQLRLIRLALAMSHVPEGVSDESDMLDSEVQLPPYLGARYMKPLSSPEILLAQTIKPVLRASLEQHDPEALAYMTDNHGKKLDRATYEEGCKTYTYPSCEVYDLYKARRPLQFRMKMQYVANRAIDALPEVALLSKLPITDADLAKAIQTSRDTFKAWGDDLKNDKTNQAKLLLGFPNAMNACMRKNPDLCSSVERRATQLNNQANAFKWAKLTGQVVGTGAVCYFSGGVGCVLFGGMLGVTETISNVKTYNRQTQRYLAQDPGFREITASDTENAQRDVLTSLGLTFLGMAPAARVFTNAVPGVHEATVASVAVEEAVATSEVTVSAAEASAAQKIVQGVGKEVGNIAKDDGVKGSADNLKPSADAEQLLGDGDKTVVLLFEQLATNIKGN